MAKVHPSSIVGPRVELGEGVEVGPGCVVEGEVTIGAGTRLIGHVYLRGPVRIGAGNTLYPFVCIGFEPQDRKFTVGSPTSGVVIGERNLIREGVTIHCASHGPPEPPTTVGDDNFLMSNSHLAHDVLVGSRCTLASGALVGGHARVDDEVNIGGNGALHQHCRLGRLSFVGGVSAVSKDVPPFAVASGITNIVGVNLVGLRRSGVERAAIDAVVAAFDTLYLEGHSNPVAATLIAQRAAEGGPGAALLMELAEFIRSSTRGLCPHTAAQAGHKIRR